MQPHVTAIQGYRAVGRLDLTIHQHHVHMSFMHWNVEELDRHAFYFLYSSLSCRGQITPMQECEYSIFGRARNVCGNLEIMEC